MKKIQSPLEKKFGQTGAKGKRGEDIVKEMILKQFEGSKLIDRTEDFSFQRKGIDFTLVLKDNNFINFDVKNNAFVGNNGNIIFAIEVEKEGKMGWFFTSHSEWIVHYCEQTNSALYYKKNDLMKVIRNNQDKFKISVTKKGDKVIYIDSENNLVKGVINFIK